MFVETSRDKVVGFILSLCVRGCPMSLEDIRGCQRSPICRIEIFQDGSHFSASPVPHLRHLRHLLIVCLILRHLFQSTNENAVP